MCQVTWKWQLAMTQDDVQRGINKKLEQEDSHVWKSPKMSHLDSIFCPIPIEFGSKCKFLWFFARKFKKFKYVIFVKASFLAGKVKLGIWQVFIKIEFWTKIESFLVLWKRLRVNIFVFCLKKKSCLRRKWSQILF